VPPKDDDGGDTKPKEPAPEPEMRAKPVKPKIPGGMGFGANVMAELEQKQKKRLSMVRSTRSRGFIYT